MVNVAISTLHHRATLSSGALLQNWWFCKSHVLRKFVFTQLHTGAWNALLKLKLCSECGCNGMKISAFMFIKWMLINMYTCWCYSNKMNFKTVWKCLISYIFDCMKRRQTWSQVKQLNRRLAVVSLVNTYWRVNRFQHDMSMKMEFITSAAKLLFMSKLKQTEHTV